MSASREINQIGSYKSIISSLIPTEKNNESLIKSDTYPWYDNSLSDKSSEVEQESSRETTLRLRKPIKWNKFP